jgi:ABC-type nitrate/sulfonate/bicarbonate transport system substrate-binding protein
VEDSVAEIQSSVRRASTEPVTELWYSRCGAATASAIAIRKKWLQAEFAGNGTVLHSLRDSEERAILDSHYHHGLSGLFREGGNIPPIWARANGAATAVVGITWLDEYQGILVRADSDIRKVDDLVGKRLALPLHNNLIDFQRGAAHHGFVTALGLAGARAKDATFVDVPAEQGSFRDDDARRQERPIAEVDALLAGKVDAIFLRFARGVRTAQDPRFRQLININELEDPRLRVNNGTPRPVTVDRKFLEARPDLVARYLAVLLRTSAWAEQHSREVQELLVSEGGARTVDEVLASHGPNVHRAFTPKLTDDYISGLELQKNFLRDHGYLKSDFDAWTWIERKPLIDAQRLFDAQPEFAPGAAPSLDSKRAEPATATATV